MHFEEYTLQKQYFVKGENIEELYNILDTLKKIIKSNPENPQREALQLRNLAQIIADCTHHSVEYSIRKEGLLVLKLVIECLAEAVHGYFVCLLAHAVDLSSYGITYPLPEPFLKMYMQIEPTAVIFPTVYSSETKKRENLKLMQLIFSFLETASLKQFTVWLELLKRTYFAFLFPKACSIIAAGDFGFQRCPPDILNVVVLALLGWNKNYNIHERLLLLLLGNQLYTEIACQVFQLELAFYETIAKFSSVFKTWLIEAQLIYWQERERLGKFFVHTLSSITQQLNDPKAKPITELFLWTIHSSCVFVICELQKSSLKIEDLEAIVSGFLRCTCANSLIIATAALQSLSTLALTYRSINCLHIQCLRTILDHLASHFETILKRQKIEKGLLVCQYLSCMLDWIIAGKADALKSNNSACTNILSTLETALSSTREFFGPDKDMAISDLVNSFMRQLAVLHNSIETQLQKVEPLPSLYYSFKNNVIWEISDDHEYRGKIKLLVRTHVAQFTRSIPYDISVRRIHQEWKELDAQDFYCLVQLERFLNKIVEIAEFSYIVGFQLLTRSNKTPQTKRNFRSLLRWLASPKEKPVQTSVSLPSLRVPKATIADFSMMHVNPKFTKQLMELDGLPFHNHIEIAVIQVLGQQKGKEHNLAYNTFIQELGSLSSRLATDWLVTQNTVTLCNQVPLCGEIMGDKFRAIWCTSVGFHMCNSCANIIVRTLPNDFCRIDVLDKNLPGPILDGMVLSANVLPILLLQTVINANRINLHKGSALYQARKAMIQEIMADQDTKHSIN